MVTAMERTVRLAGVEIEKDIANVLKIRSGAIMLGEIMEGFPALRPMKV